MARNGALLSLEYARNVYAAVDRRSQEACALARWFEDNAVSYDMAEPSFDDDGNGFTLSRQRGVAQSDWRTIGEAFVLREARLAGTPDAPASCWVKAIRQRLGLDLLETQIFALALYYKTDKRVSRLFDNISSSRGSATYLHRDADLFALLLNAPADEIEKRLMVGGRFLNCGLLNLDRDGDLALLDQLKSAVRRGVSPGADIYDQLLGTTVAAPLPWGAFAHLGQEADIAASVLRAALAQREGGINILLYGAPGTGKTSFAATLAARIGARLRPVAEADEAGGEPSRYERLAGLRLAQRLVSPGNTVLLFDEAEDLFARFNEDPDEPSAHSRVFMHRLLERVLVPVIWTANDISVLGPAVLRRMTMCLELKVPNLPTRARLWREMAHAEGVLLNDADATRLARLVPSAPAVASTALRATRMAGGQAHTARVIVEGVTRAVLGGAIPAPERADDALYDPALVNADCDLGQLLEQLVRPGSDRAVSFLLSGPPGCGKSAWIRYLADKMDLPLLPKRASDLLDPYVGGTERQIAEAFAEARDTKAFLVFDEADSLLRDRADALRGWEVSQVNEMLTWMEEHALPFACTTNLPDRLDRASLRRFLVKVRFEWLTPAQVRSAFARFFGQPAPPSVDGLAMLTPADFALVRRRATLTGVTDPAALARFLAAECEGRVGVRRPMGFATRADCDGS